MINIIISTGKKISVIKEEFNRQFPYLKLEFFKHKHNVMAGNPHSDLIQSDFTLKEIPKSNGNVAVEVTEDMQVGVLEQLFQEKFGVSAQVFRKSGRSWLETSVTDDWTLKRQNDEGRELSGFTR
ncbi:MAG: hypothetical protein IT236_15055 [Bacteroidia bacterium]|nr:hypothetical protein [Bacteroidia bacterium]